MAVNVEKLQDWLNDHIDDYIALDTDDTGTMSYSYSVDTNKMAHDLIEFMREKKVA